MTIEDLVRGKIGDERYEALLDETDAVIKKKASRITKARGYFQSGNGIHWHVNPQGNVRGLHPDGSKIRDKVYEKENELRLGPFFLDEGKTCSCIHWLRKEDPEKQWVWASDRTVNTRIKMGSW